uniref:ComF family protein n=1 Tax=Candidatus Kentrum sp. DK TaxID=2126562 RepID=A0A450TBM3_9GAMM|nr:MAG: comF family protein [Candidatus Kentron sp. DK]VFJ64115.1 MAG: comF family protein [Candidatus Kentron sp. DK]
MQKFVFTTSCLLCGAEVAGSKPNLCPDCLRDLPVIDAACPVCGIPLPEPVICPACQRRHPPFTRTHAAFRYGFPVNHLVVLMKFHEKLAAARVLGELLADYLEMARVSRPELLIPVPLHVGRLRERGFNQALEIGREVARRREIPIRKDWVVRKRATPPQTDLPNRAARGRNVRGAFALNGPVPKVGHIAILDDVMTSGATVTEVAGLLRRAGIPRVDVWCCCRAGEMG